ncbi:MAG: DUF1902 domain-containing protein [Treponema sp.]|nr:DUF1902 domain-containing protein [Treponema sp.]
MDLEIHAEYDEDARVLVAHHEELELATETETVEVLTYKLQEMLPELAELNGIDVPHPITFTIVSRRPATAFA